MDIKALFGKFLRKEVPPENKIIDEGTNEKSSRIWGTDEEFSYARAATIAAMSIPQPQRMRTYNDYVRQYGNNVWVYAAVYQISTSIASIPWYLYKKFKYKKGKNDKRIEDNPNNALVQLFQKPNPFMSSFDLKEAIVAGLELTGNAYLEEVVNNGQLVEVYPLQPHKVEIVPDRKKMIAGYVYKSSGGYEVNYTADEITHLKYFSPTSDFYGQAPMAPGEISVSTDNHSIIGIEISL